jgi:DNA-binding MarR family transcriptional regulator
VPATNPLRDVDYSALAEFRFRLRKFLAFSEAQARRAGLTPQQHQLLLAVRASAQPMTIGALAERLILRHHSTVELIDRLAEKALVRRVAGRDRRQARIELTPAGTEVLRRLSIAHGDELRRAAPDLIEALVGASGAWRATTVQRTSRRHDKPRP